jgi:uncharacterized SAM-binding protein YcdF (DUF218 family)
VVLGSSMVDEAIMGYSSYWRAVYAVREWRSGAYTSMLISGGPGQEGHTSVAEAMQQFLVANGVPRQAIRLETQSGNTHENAEWCARVLGNTTGNKVLLTSDYHAFRACRAFRSAGIDILCHPIPDAAKRYSTSWTQRLGAAGDLALETAKIAYYWWKGWLKP